MMLARVVVSPWSAFGREKGVAGMPPTTINVSPTTSALCLHGRVQQGEGEMRVGAM